MRAARAPDGIAQAMTAASSAAAKPLENARVIEHLPEIIGQQRVLDLAGDAPSGGHRLRVVEIRIRRAVDEEVVPGDDASRDLHHVKLNVGRDDRFDAEGAE